MFISCSDCLKLCDVILVSGDHRIPAHKLVLGSASDYFAAAFYDDSSADSTATSVVAFDDVTEEEADTNNRKSFLKPAEFVIPTEVDPAILDDVVAYVYTGRW